jgi:23S rRNA pseudouridine2457 synthase
MLLLFNKPFDVLCQFTDQRGRLTLKNYIKYNNLYPCGRLDRDSEGLLLLTDDGRLQHLISHPKHKLEKRYWVQVEGIPDNHALSRLRQGVELRDGITAPARVHALEPPDVWPRTPPIRSRANIPTTWLELTIKEGRNRQVRRMTAAVGHPTLRLIRVAIGPWQLDQLLPGEYKQVTLDFAILPNYWRKILNQPATDKAIAKKPSRRVVKKPKSTRQIL